MMWAVSTESQDEQSGGLISTAKLQAIGEWLAEFKGISFDEIAPYLYT